MFEIKLLFWALLGCINFETMHPEIFLCTPLVYSYDNWVKKRAHIGRTCAKNVRPAAKMCAPGAECIVNFEHCVRVTVTEIKGVWTFFEPFIIAISGRVHGEMSGCTA